MAMEGQTMDEPMITRRKALAMAGTAAGALGATAALTGVRGVQAASAGVDGGVAGTWDIKVTPTAGGGGPFASLVSFAPGGALVTVNNQGPGNVSIGAWEGSGGGEFDAVFESYSFDAKGMFVGTAIIRPKGIVDGEHIHGTFSVAFRPASGPTQHGVEHGTFTGSRLQP
jgi:hypothetical protein